VSDFISSAYRFCESVGSISRPHDILPVVDSISKQRRLRLFAIWIVPQHPEDFAAWKLDETSFAIRSMSTWPRLRSEPIGRTRRCP
jgi:hypothetical protein